MAVFFPRSDLLAEASRLTRTAGAPATGGGFRGNVGPSISDIVQATKAGVDLVQSILDSRIGAESETPDDGGQMQPQQRPGPTIATARPDTSGTQGSRVQDYLDSLRGGGRGGDQAGSPIDAVLGATRQRPAEAASPVAGFDPAAALMAEEDAQRAAMNDLDAGGYAEFYRKHEGSGLRMPERPPRQVSGPPSKEALRGLAAMGAYSPTSRGDMDALVDAYERPMPGSTRDDRDLLARAFRKPVEGLDEEMGIDDLLRQAREEGATAAAEPAPEIKADTGAAGDLVAQAVRPAVPRRPSMNEAWALAPEARTAEQRLRALNIAIAASRPQTPGERLFGTYRRRAAQEVAGMFPAAENEAMMEIQRLNAEARMEAAEAATARAQAQDALLEEKRRNLNAKTDKLLAESKRIDTLTEPQRQKLEEDIRAVALETAQAEAEFPGKLAEQRARTVALVELASLRRRLPATSETARMAQVSRQSDAEYLKYLLAERATQEKRAADARSVIEKASITIRDVPTIFDDPVRAKAAIDDATSDRNAATAAYRAAQTEIDRINIEIAEVAKALKDARALRPAGETETVTTGSAAVRGPRKPGANVGPLLDELEKQGEGEKPKDRLYDALGR